MDPFYETPAGRALLWASNVGRYLVIFTEIVVILSFASRFTLDRQLNDLNLSILQQSYLIESYGTLENDTRIIQKKIEYLQQQTANISPVTMIELVRTTLPRTVFLNSMTIRGNQITIQGETEFAESLSRLVSSLARKSEVGGLYVDSVQNRKNGLPGFEFTLRVEMRSRG